jgi:hypothetical protein
MARKKTKFLVIHCSATPEGREVTEADIRRWHLSPKPQGRGWKQVGYTDLFHLDGSVTRLADNNDDGYVDSWEITNGAVGINSVSRHIVYAGGIDSVTKKPKDTRTDEQKRSLEVYVKEFIYNNPDILVAGHYHFSNKACPSFDVENWLEYIGIPEENIFRG